MRYIFFYLITNIVTLLFVKIAKVALKLARRYAQTAPDHPYCPIQLIEIYLFTRVAWPIREDLVPLFGCDTFLYLSEIGH